MPKLKTSKGAAKRFKITKKGKVKYTQAMRRHILTSKARKTKRRLRSRSYLTKGDRKKIKGILPYL